MPINLKTEPLPKYNKDEYLKKFITLVFENAPEYDSFLLRKLPKQLNLSETDKKIFVNLNVELNRYFIDNGYANFDKTRKLTLTDEGRNVKNGTETESSMVYNDFSGSNIGQVIQDSDLKKTKNEITQTIQPIEKEKQQNAIISFISKFWWQVLIPIIVGMVLLYMGKNNIIDLF